MEDILTAHHILTEWRPDLITHLLDMLEPDRVRVAVVGKKFESICDQTEPWYGTKYRLEKIPQETFQVHYLSNSLTLKLMDVP